MTPAERNELDMTIADAPRSLRDELQRLQEIEIQSAKLRGFAQDAMAHWPESSIDGDTLQEMGIKHGLLNPERRHAPCGEACACLAYDVLSAEWADGIMCYRKTALLKGVQT